MPTITVLQPESGVPLDRFDGWLREAGMDIEVCQLWSDQVPAIRDCGDGLLLLGGRPNALDEQTQPWLPEVRNLLREAINAEIPTLCICLGHQILAHTFGGTVTLADARGPEKGAHTLRLHPGASSDPVLGALSHGAVVAESHYDVVTTLPDGAEPLASTEKYDNQAFRIGSSLGVQFHPEASPTTMGFWTASHGGDGEAMRAHMEQADHLVAPAGRALAHSFAAYTSHQQISAKLSH